MKKERNKKLVANRIEDRAIKIISHIGSVESLIIHTILFLAFFFLGLVGLDWGRLLLILTTVLSLEAIYLSIFIQMTVNKNTESLAEVEEDIEEIQEDIDDIQEDVDEIQEDVDEIAEDDKEAEDYDLKQATALNQIQDELQKLSKTIESLQEMAKR